MKWIEELNELTLAFKAENNRFVGLEAQNLKASPKEWSFAQIVEHLIRINESYFPVFDKIIAGTYKAGLWKKMPGMAGFFGKIVLKAVSPKTKKKTKTFPVWEPSQTKIERVYERFEQHQSRLIAYYEKLIPLLRKSDPVIASPASAIVVYRLSLALLCIVEHEKRHLEQSKRLRLA